MQAKELFVAFFGSILLLPSLVFAGPPLSHTFSRHDDSEPVARAAEEPVAPTTEKEEREFWISPSANVDLYIEELKTHISRVGIIPGLGYGVRWNPKCWQTIGADINSKSLVNLDIYIQASSIDRTPDFEGNDYMAIDVLPAITIIDWVSFGLGYRWKRSLHEGLDNDGTTLLSIGVRKSL